MPGNINIPHFLCTCLGLNTACHLPGEKEEFTCTDYSFLCRLPAFRRRACRLASLLLGRQLSAFCLPFPAAPPAAWSSFLRGLLLCCCALPGRVHSPLGIYTSHLPGLPACPAAATAVSIPATNTVSTTCHTSHFSLAPACRMLGLLIGTHTTVFFYFLSLPDIKSMGFELTAWAVL